jgi:hypothetical protein
MSKRAGWSLWLGAAVLFFVLNRPAYKGYFQADDLDTMSWARWARGSDFVKWMLTQQLPPANFRPVGAFYYHAMVRSFGCDFPNYLVPLHALHLLNIWLVWLLIRKLGMGPLAATAGAFFFGFHAALIDAWWKPMYAFDVLCGTFLLLALLLYAYDRWFLSLIAFWLAFKSKELAIALPVVLAGYEVWFGGKRWKWLIPFFAISALFGMEALLMRPERGDYQLQLGWGAQAATVRYYASQLFFVPYAGLAALALPFVIRGRQVWFGFATTCALMAPLLLLPGRLFAVYWYVPILGVAIMLASCAEGRRGAAAVAGLLALWIPWDFLHFREARRVIQRQEQQYREYVASIEKFARANPQERVFVWDHLPDGFEHWGVSGALACIYDRTDITTRFIDEPGTEALLQSGQAVWLRWMEVFQRVDVVHFARLAKPAPYITMDEDMPGGQLISGWYGLDWNTRWAQPDAVSVLTRPSDARSFEVTACLSKGQISALRTVDFDVLFDGQPVGHRVFAAPECATLRWPLPPGPAGTVKVGFRTRPPFHDASDKRNFGIVIRAFGFVRDAAPQIPATG